MPTFLKLPPNPRLGMEERPYSSRLKKVGELLDQDAVSREEVVSELGGWTLTNVPQPTMGLLGQLELLLAGPLAGL